MKGTVHYILNYQPGDGTAYDLCIFEDPYGGYLVVWPNQCTYRAYPKWTHDIKESDKEQLRIEMICLHGNENKYTASCMRDVVKDLVFDGVIS